MDDPAPTSGYRLTEMPAREATADQQFDRIDDAIAAARRRIQWAAATGGWETDYRAGPSPEWA